MLTKNLFLLVTLILVIGSCMAQDKIQYLEIPSKSNLKEFVGKAVKITGKKPEIISQHPILTTPEGLGKKEFQNYIDTEYGQLIVVSEKEIDCSDKITILGMINNISLGGKKNTKNSYENFFIKADSFECK